MLGVRALHCLAILVITLGAVPQSPEVLELRARTALQESRYREALDAFAALVAREPNNPSYHYGKGVALSSLLDHGAAADALEKVVKDPEDPQLRMNLALALEQLGKVEEAGAEREMARRLEANQ